MTNYLGLARDAAVTAYGPTSVGEFSHTLQEAQDNVISYLFASKLKGYPDWYISVTLFINGWEATVSEVVLAPGEASLVAPKWVPWSERLADYKALQAALEAEAEAAAALAEEVDETDEDADEAENSDDVSNLETVSDEESAATNDVAELALAPADVPETPEAEDNSDATGGKAQGFFKWKTLRGKKKNK